MPLRVVLIVHMRLPVGAIRGVCSSLLLASLLSGCGTTANLYLKNEGMVTGRVERSDEKIVFVRAEVVDGGMAYTGGPLKRIPRSSIVDVTHPGNGAMVIGVISTAVGLALLKANSSCGLFTMEIPCQLSHGPLYIGVPLFFWGLGTHSSSSAAMRPGSEERPKRRPGVADDENRWRGP